MISVLHVLPGNPYGGMQRLVAWLAAEQKRKGLNVAVVSLIPNPIFTQELQNRDVRNIQIEDANPIRRLARLVRIIKQEKPAIVHMHVGLLAISLAGIFVRRSTWIGHYHTYPHKDAFKLRLLNYINRRLCRRFIGVSASVSRALVDTLKIPKSNVSTVYNGIEANAHVCSLRDYRESDSPRYGMAARLVEEKGVLDFINLAEKILIVQPNAQFVLAGMGPLRAALQQLVKEKNLSGHVRLAGHLTDMESFWRSLDVAVFLSKLEAFGLTILEAMNAGTPLVARLNGTGSDEIVIEHISDFCVQPNDTESLAEQCIRLTTNKELWTQASRRNYHDFCQHYSIKRMANGINQNYSHVLGTSAKNHESSLAKRP